MDGAAGVGGAADADGEAGVAGFAAGAAGGSVDVPTGLLKKRKKSDVGDSTSRVSLDPKDAW